MKLRLRSFETNETLRVEVPSTCSLQQLRDVLYQRSASASSSSVHFSLNRKDELLSSSPEDSLQSLGVTSGDLIFFTLNPSVISSETLVVQSDAPQGSISERPQSSQDSLTLNPNSQKQQIIDSDYVNSETLVVHSDAPQGSRSERPHNSQDSLTLDPNSQKQQIIDSESLNSETLGLDAQKEKTLDSNTQIGETVEYMEVDDDGSVLEVGKSFSVPGFLRKVFTEELGDDEGRHHKLLVIAVHAVLLESGFVRFDPVSKMVVNGWPSTMSRLSLWYSLPEIIGKGPVNADGIDAVVLKFQSLGKFFTVYGSIANGSGPHMVRVDEDYLVPFLNVVWANCGLVDDTNGKDVFSSSYSEREVFTFWRTVKDRLSLPLLIDISEKAGLDLPPCFMCLPTDLKLKILESLPGVDVAKVGCVCSELRYLTSSDDLWKQKYVEYFVNAERSEGGSHWKEKFARSLESRKRRKMGITLFRRRRRDYLPFHVPPIIGGDYDVWPQLGPLVPVRQPGLIFPRLRNLVPRCNLGGPSP